MTEKSPNIDARHPTLKPQKVKEDRLHGDAYAHDAFGQIRVGRLSGGGVLYGSEFQHHNAVRIEITRSELIRNLSSDRYSPRNSLIAIDLSEGQWAEFVSSMGNGGVPCTVRRVGSEPMPFIERAESTQEKFNMEAHESVKNALGHLGNLINQLKDAKMTERQRTELVGSAEGAYNALRSSVPFIAEQFSEHIERTVNRARAEINAHVSRSSGALSLPEDGGLLALDNKHAEGV